MCAARTILTPDGFVASNCHRIVIPEFLPFFGKNVRDPLIKFTNHFVIARSDNNLRHCEERQQPSSLRGATTTFVIARSDNNLRHCEERSDEAIQL